MQGSRLKRSHQVLGLVLMAARHWHFIGHRSPAISGRIAASKRDDPLLYLHALQVRERNKSFRSQNASTAYEHFSSALLLPLGIEPVIPAKHQQRHHHQDDHSD